MTKYVIRVTRNSDGETADVEVEDAKDWSAAKRIACQLAKDNEDYLFGPPAPDQFYVTNMDDDEEAAKQEAECL